MAICISRVAWTSPSMTFASAAIAAFRKAASGALQRVVEYLTKTESISDHGHDRVDFAQHARAHFVERSVLRTGER